MKKYAQMLQQQANELGTLLGDSPFVQNYDAIVAGPSQPDTRTHDEIHKDIVNDELNRDKAYSQ